MMRDRPDSASLLATARQAILDDLVPDLPPERRYTALMIAAAMAIAAREMAAGTAWLDAEREALAALLGEDGDTRDVALAELDRIFAVRLRRGDFDADGAARKEASRILRETTLARLAECNPNYPADR